MPLYYSCVPLPRDRVSDLLDSCSPTFDNLINGQVNLRDAIRRQIDFETGGKKYKLAQNPAVLLVRYVCTFNTPISLSLIFT